MASWSLARSSHASFSLCLQLGAEQWVYQLLINGWWERDWALVHLIRLWNQNSESKGGHIYKYINAYFYTLSKNPWFQNTSKHLHLKHLFWQRLSLWLSGFVGEILWSEKQCHFFFLSKHEHSLVYKLVEGRALPNKKDPEIPTYHSPFLHSNTQNVQWRVDCISPSESFPQLQRFRGISQKKTQYI